MREIDYYLTKADYREFYVVACARRLWKFGLLLGLLLAGLNSWSEFCRCGYLSILDVMDAALWGFGISGAACLGVLLLNAFYARQVHAAMEPIAKGQKISWNDDAVRLDSSFFSAAYPWSLFNQTVETKRVIAAYLTPVSPLLFPKSAMSDEELTDLRKHLRSSKSS